MCITYALGGSEVARRQDFDLYDLQDEKKQRDDSPVTRSKFMSIFLMKVKVFVKQWRKKQTKNLSWIVERCRQTFGSRETDD